MMMTRKLFYFWICSILFVGTAFASDTIQTPTPLLASAVVVKSDNSQLSAAGKNVSGSRSIRLNPRAISFVQGYKQTHTKMLMDIKSWGLPYFNLIEEILVQYNLPVELKYLAVIESKLKSSAVSKAGATGPWQFMPATAKGYGLQITKGRDDRKDFKKSTHAAAKYLKYLYGEFGDWLLVIAAYNSGPGYVYNAIKKSGSRNFWELQHLLPAESRNHVKRFISTHYIYEGQGSICTLTKSEATEQIGSLAGYLMNRNLTAEELKNSTTTTISGKYRAMVIAKYINMDTKEFARYNPDFDKVMDSGANSYELQLPAEDMEKFVANKYPILNESLQMLIDNAMQEAAFLQKPQTTAVR